MLLRGQRVQVNLDPDTDGYPNFAKFQGRIGTFIGDDGDGATYNLWIVYENAPQEFYEKFDADGFIAGRNTQPEEISKLIDQYVDCWSEGQLIPILLEVEIIE